MGLLLGLALALGQVPAVAEELTGRQIMDEVSRRHERPAELSLEKMVLLAEGELEAERELRRYLRQSESETYRYLLVYDSPSGIAGTAALTWEVKNAQDDQWLFLPSLNRLKRIIGAAKRRNFMGTDFSFEDLTVEDEDEHSYEREADQRLDGLDHFVVKALPFSEDVKATTGYAYRRIYVRKDSYFINKVEYFEKGSEDHIKTLTVVKAGPVDGETWRASEFVMESHDDDHATEVEVLEQSFDPELAPQRVFEHRYLTSKAHMR